MKALAVGKIKWSALACAAGLGFTQPAQASALALLSNETLAAMQVMQLLSTPNLCIFYTYDENGNILSRSNATFGSTTLWGSAKFGCFAWTP